MFSLVRGGGRGGSYMLCDFSPLRSHCFARSRLAFDVHSLALAKERTKKTSKGARPLDSRAFASLTMRRSKGLLSKISRLVRHRLQDGWVRGAMPYFGKYAADIAKNWECGCKPFWKMEGGKLNPCRLRNRHKMEMGKIRLKLFAKQMWDSNASVGADTFGCGDAAFFKPRNLRATEEKCLDGLRLSPK